MELKTLGGLELEKGAFTRPKPLLLVVYLALEGTQSRRFLAELFWPEASNRMKSLTVALTQLRKGAPGVLAADAIQAEVTVGTDAGRFLELIDGRRFERALDLYRGPFLHGFHLPGMGAELEEWIYGTREFLADRARQALLGLAEREAAEGRFEEAAARAEEAAGLAGAPAAEPEDLARLYTLLLAGGSGRAGELRREAEGFGLELPRTRAKACDTLKGSSTPGAVRASTSLPTRSTPFVGRDLELTEISGLLGDPGGRLVTVVGPAGVGKTRLALQAARDQQQLGAFADGVHFLALDALANPELVPSRIAAALNLELGTGDPLEELAARLEGWRLLLLLDTFEHLADGALQLSTLLRACPELRLLVTSRERLNLEEERTFPVQGLPCAPEGLTLAEAKRYDAVNLFLQRARRARPDLRPVEDDLPAVLAICRLVEGLPLGLELAAVWARIMPFQEIAQELEGNLDLLAAEVRDLPERHRSIRAAFDASWRRLTPREQGVLARLAVFRGGFRRDAAAEVAGATIPILASLVDKSLLRVSLTGRYDRHPLLYQFSRERLAESPAEADQTAERHALLFARLLDERTTDLQGPKHGEALAALEQELGNLRAAWRQAVRERRDQELARMAAPLAALYDTRNAFLEGSDLLAEGIEALRDDPGEALGELLTARSGLSYRLGHYAEAEEQARGGIDLLRSPGAWKAHALGLNTLSAVAVRSGNYAAGKAHFAEALALAREHDDPTNIGRFLSNLAVAEQMLGEYEAARRHFEEAIEVRRKLGDQRFVVRGLNSLGNLSLSLEDTQAAGGYFRRGLDLAQELDIREIVPYFLVNLGIVAMENGALDEAEPRFAEAFEKARESGNRPLMAGALRRLGRVKLEAGAFDEARGYLLRSLALARDLDALPAQINALFNLADLRARRGETEASLELFGLVLEHPATDDHERRRARNAVEALRSRIAPDAAETALARGAAADLSGVVTRLLVIEPIPKPRPAN